MTVHRVLLAVLIALMAGPAHGQIRGAPVPPIIEEMRMHERLLPMDLPGHAFSLTGPDDIPVNVFIPEGVEAGAVRLVIHFHGADWLVNRAVSELGEDVVAASINTGGLSSSYSRPFAEPDAFDSLVRMLEDGISAAWNGRITFEGIVLSSFSAGYGAVRAILREHGERPEIDAVLLLDGMHAGYLSDDALTLDGSRIDPSHVLPFVDFAAKAARGEKRFVMTHSEIRPGSYASNAETASWLIGQLGLQRVSEPGEGPRRMRLRSAARQRGLTILGFAGDEAPDHVDHLHALPEMLRMAVRR